MCGKEVQLEPSRPPGDAPCPHCGSLLWFPSIGPRRVYKLRDLIHALCGLVIPKEKVYLVEHRLEPVLREYAMKSFEELAAALRCSESGGIREAILEAITTQETSFFRDRHPFETFRSHILPEAMKAARSPGGMPRPVKIWAAGVATGQEAYSLAMIVYDYLTANSEHRPNSPGALITATDISRAAIRRRSAASIRRGKWHGD